MEVEGGDETRDIPKEVVVEVMEKTLKESWMWTCKESGHKGPGAEHDYSQGRIGCYAWHEIMGKAESEHGGFFTEKEALNAVGGTGCKDGFVAIFHGMVLAEFEGAYHVFKSMDDNRMVGEVANDDEGRKYAMDLELAVNTIRNHFIGKQNEALRNGGEEMDAWKEYDAAVSEIVKKHL